MPENWDKRDEIMLSFTATHIPQQPAEYENIKMLCMYLSACVLI